jgi:hypothetical protein
VTVIVAGGRGVPDFGPGDEQDDVDTEYFSSSSSSIWAMIRSFIESTREVSLNLWVCRNLFKLKQTNAYHSTPRSTLGVLRLLNESLLIAASSSVASAFHSIVRYGHDASVVASIQRVWCGCLRFVVPPPPYRLVRGWWWLGTWRSFFGCTVNWGLETKL